MTRFRIDLRGGAFASVLGFTFAHWRRQPGRLALIILTFLVATLAGSDLSLQELFVGRALDLDEVRHLHGFRDAAE